MDFRKTFDQIPERFDQFRPRYCQALFDELKTVCALSPGKQVLEIGPGTGQATEPVLQTGCDYTAIELGENFTAFMQDKYHVYPNFHIVNADFETYPFEKDHYDLVYSAATIQWIPEKIAFTKTYDMLKPGGYLAMFMTRSDERSENPALREAIDRIYEKYFHVDQHYSCSMVYQNVLDYGFENLVYKEWKSKRVLTAEEYISYISTHCEHIILEEPYKSRFFEGIREVIMNAGGMIVIIDTIPLYLVQKPVSAT